MPRNGSGGYNQPVSNFVAGTTIVSADVNSWFGDLGTEMANSIAKDGQTTPTNNLPMGGFRHTGVGNATARAHYLSMAQAQDGAADWRGVAGGTANAITLTTSPVTTGYTTGEIHTFITGAAANTGAVTINVNSHGAVALVTASGAALVAGNLPANSLVSARYSGTSFVLIAPPATAIGQALLTSATAAAAQDVILPVAWVDVASAATTDLGATNAANLRITGTTTITAFGTAASGTRRQLRFAGVLTLTHNATSLILPGAANIVTAANDTALAISLGSGNWVVVDYQRASGNFVRGTAQATTSGGSIDFTGIPPGVRRITLTFDGVSFSGVDGASVILGDSGGFETTGYSGAIGVTAGTSAGTISTLSAGIPVIYGGTAAADTCSGVLQLFNQSGNKWVFHGQVARSGTAQLFGVAGVKELSATLDRVRFDVDGASTFDAGEVNIFWEF